MLAWISDDGVFRADVKWIGNDAFDGKSMWRWVLYSEGEVIADGEDLRTRSSNEADALRALCSFLGAWCEAMRYEGSENRDLFPELCYPVVDTYADDFYLAIGTEDE